MDQTPEDMSNLFRFFRIPTPLYDKWYNYAKQHKQNASYALADLLHSVQNVSLPSYEDTGYIDIAIDHHIKQPKIYKQGLIKQFHYQYPDVLRDEIFYIFRQTGYKNQTLEMNKEICTRLAYALKLRRVVIPLRVLFLSSPQILSHRGVWCILSCSLTVTQTRFNISLCVLTQSTWCMTHP